MKEPKDLIAEDFLEPWCRYTHEMFRKEPIKDYDKDVTKGAIDYAKYHVKQALIAVQKLQTKKEVQGYPGTLTKEELDNVYSLDRIK